MLRSSTWRGGIALAVLVTAATACTSTPTSPSRSPAALLGAAAPLSSEVSVELPNALGAVRFVAFGDSITYGTLSSFDGLALFDGPTFGYPSRLEGSLNSFHAPQRFLVLDRGVPGEAVTTDGVRRIASVLTTDRPQALLLLEGINDLSDGVSVASIGSALQRIIDTSLQRGVPVFLATMFQTYAVERPDGTFRENGAELITAFNQRIRTMANQPNVYLVDIHAAFGTRRDYVGADGLHPTTAGYDAMAVAFLRAIERAYPVRGSFQ